MLPQSYLISPSRVWWNMRAINNSLFSFWKVLHWSLSSIGWSMLLVVFFFFAFHQVETNLWLSWCIHHLTCAVRDLWSLIVCLLQSLGDAAYTSGIYILNSQISHRLYDAYEFYYYIFYFSFQITTDWRRIKKPQWDGLRAACSFSDFESIIFLVGSTEQCPLSKCIWPSSVLDQSSTLNL